MPKNENQHSLIVSRSSTYDMNQRKLGPLPGSLWSGASFTDQVSGAEGLN